MLGLYALNDIHKQDKQQFVLGQELISNGGFDTDTIWNKDASWSIGGGIASHVAGITDNITQNILIKNSWYIITWTILNYVAGAIRIGLGATVGTSLGLIRNSNGSFIDVIPVDIPNPLQTIYFIGYLPFNGGIDDISCKEIIQL